MNFPFKHVMAIAGALLLAGAAAGALWVWSGSYNIGADDEHTAPVLALLSTLRERSIEAHAVGLEAPDLADTQRIVQGAGNYAAMCAGCHLAPGMEPTELSHGLYPAPPDLSRHKVDPVHAFWVIKHGIKASGMPAWGKSMADEYVWNMAAFLQRMPTLDPQQYRQMVASSGGHSHGGGESESHHSGDPIAGHQKAGGTAVNPVGESEGEHSHDAAKFTVKQAVESGLAKSEPPKPPARHHDDGHKH